MKKGQSQMEYPKALILLIIGVLIIGSIIFLAAKKIKEDKEGELQLCRMFVCLGESVQEGTRGVLETNPAQYCRPYDFDIPKNKKNKNRDGIMREIAELVDDAWQEMCDGPSEQEWTRWKSVFGEKECFPAFYFTIKEDSGLKKEENITAIDLQWYLSTTTMNRPLPTESGSEKFTYAAYVQFYDAPGRIDVLTDFVVGEVYVIAVATPKGIPWLRSEDNIPHVVITKASDIRGVCDAFA